MNSSFKIMARRILPLRRGDPAIQLSNDNRLQDETCSGRSLSFEGT
jgi:hypothetical protein